MSLSREQVIDAISGGPDGSQMADLEAALRANRRTILRHLNELVADGTVRRMGAGRGTRYVLAHAPRQVEPLANVGPVFSTAAREALIELQKPISGRRPVGYAATFLLDYRPGSTTYADEALRRHLRPIGALTGERLPAGTYARRVLDRLLIDLSWNSSRLEGNTYSMLETERLFAAGVESPERDPRETQMILNHKAAIEFLVDSADEVDFDRMTVLSLHALLSDNLLSDPGDGGRLRSIAVGISGSVFEPLQNPHLIEQYFDALLERARAIDDPFEQSLFALVHLPYLQPFIDVNKRVSRLAANIPFIRENLSPLTFMDVAPHDYAYAMLAVYEQNDVSVLRDLFAWAYERSAARYHAIRQSLGEPDVFRLTHRADLKRVVAEVIRARLSRAAEEALIVQLAAELPAPDRDRFAAAVREELEALHEGNFRRFPVRPSEFRAWLENR